MNSKFEGLAKKKFGNDVRVEEKQWYLPTPEYYVPMVYAFKGDVVVGVAKSLDDLVK